MSIQGFVRGYTTHFEENAHGNEKTLFGDDGACGADT